MARRRHGTGHLYEKYGGYYGRWRTVDGRLLNRRIGPVRSAGGSDGLTRAQAERAFHKLQDEEEQRPSRRATAQAMTIEAVANTYRRERELEGASKSYLETLESIQRVHLVPHFAERPVDRITVEDVETLAAKMLKQGQSPKTVRNVLGFLHSLFELAVARGWCHENPTTRAVAPKRRRSTDSAPDLQFLTLVELEAVLRAIPDDVVKREPAPTRNGRRGPAPPPSPDVLGPVLSVLILTAAMTGLRQSELLGLRWRDIDWTAHRIRVRNAWVRGEHSARGKSDLSTRRSVPMADRLGGELDRWSKRTVYGGQDDLVFAHPQSGRPLDRSKVSKRFKQACKDAGVHVIRFHDLRHTFGTQLAAASTPLRTVQEFMGHADAKTTQIYAHYAPSEREVEMVNQAFDLARETGNNSGNKLSTTETDSDPPQTA